MNRKAALFISVILLTQVASYSFNQITPQIDWEEPFQGDSSWEASGRNSTTLCGSDYTQTSISTTLNSSVYTYGDNPELIFTIGCAVVGTNYTLSYKVWGWNTGTGASDWLGGRVNYSFVATSTNLSLYFPISNLGVDNYSVNTTLYNTTYDQTNTIGDYSGGWTWDANFTVTDCGYDENLTFVTALTFNWDAASEWVNTNITLTNMSYAGNAYCLIPGQSYSVTVQITNVSAPSYYHKYEYHNFTAINTVHHWHDWDMVLPAGNYTTKTYIHPWDVNTSAPSPIAGIHNWFMVVDNSTGWFNVTPGNNSSGNNTGPMESLDAWTDSSNYSSSEDIDLKWNATDLVWDMSINYNVTVDVYGYNMATNTTSIVWSDSSVFSSTTEWFHDGFTINAGTLSTGCYYASFDLSDDDDGMFFDNVGFEFGVNMDCSSTGGNNDSWESIEASGNVDLWWNSSDIISFDWNAFDLVWDMGIDYNVTVNVYGYNMTTNTTSIVYTDSAVFNPTNDMASGTFDISPNTLPSGCYFASFLLFDNVDGMMFAQDGFEFGVNMDCSNDDQSTMEWLEAWSALDEYAVGDDVIINWTAHDLVWNESINYIVTIDVYNSNPMNNTTGLVYSDWDGSSMFSPASDVESGWITIPSENFDDGCYYAKLELLDWDDGMQFDYAYLEFSVGLEIEDCEWDDQNNTGGNNSNDCPENFIDLDAGTSQNTYDLANWPEVELNFVVICADSGTLYSVHYNIMDNDDGTIVYDEMENWTGTGDMEYNFYNWLHASDLGVGNYSLNATLFKVDCWGCPGLDAYIVDAQAGFEVIDTSDPEYMAYNADSDDCVQSGDDFEAKILVYAGPNEPHTVNWTIVDENGAPTSWHTQDMTTGNGGSANFTWTLDTTNLSDGIYSFQIESATTGLDMISFYFQVGCTGCGYDSSLTEVNYQIWSDTFGTLFSTWNESEDGTMTGSSSNSVNDDTPQIIAGTELGFWGQIGCLEFEQDYLLNYTVTNSADLIVMGDEEYFNSGSTTWYYFSEYDISTTFLPADEYCITVTLYVSPYGGSDVIYTFTECVEIVAIEDWDGCGSNLTYLEHLQGVRGNPFVQQEVVFLTNSWITVDNFVDCLVIGENYTMHTEVTTGGSIYAESTDNFTVNQFSDITQWGWLQVTSWNTDIPIGNYCVETTIHETDATFTQQIALVSTITDCFAVVNATIDDWWDNQDNGTGNGSGTPNDPVLPDTNCSDLNGTLSGLNLTNAWNESDCENGTGFWFNLTVNGTGITWYDPIYAVGYDYEVISGPKFASIVVPPGYGDDKYDLYLWDGTEYVLVGSDLDALTEYWFTDDGGISITPGTFDGISKFSVRGLEISEKLDPEDPDAFVTGLSFVQDPNEIGEVILSMTPITVSDEDDDGIIDEEDNCVNDANADQADSDEDGVGDACEENLSTGDIDEDDDSDSDSSSSMTTIFALLAVGLIFVVIFMRGGDDEDESPPQSGKKYYPFDNSN